MVEQIIHKNIRYLQLFLIIIYVVGVVGISLPQTSAMVKGLTPITLLLSFSLLMLFYEGNVGIKVLAVFTIIALLGYFIELIGVATGLIFGTYTYGNGLGFKVHETPLLIGINWLMLSYGFASISAKIVKQPIMNVLLAATLMLVYDFVMEPVAPYLDLWAWKGNVIPIQNYLAWFVIGLVMQIVLSLSKIPTKNKIAITVIACQYVFFLLLNFLIPNP